MVQVEFFQYWTQQTNSCFSPQCLLGQIQIKWPTVAVTTIRVNSSITSKYNNITDNIRKINNVAIFYWETTNKDQNPNLTFQKEDYQAKHCQKP